MPGQNVYFVHFGNYIVQSYPCSSKHPLSPCLLLVFLPRLSPSSVIVYVVPPVTIPQLNRKMPRKNAKMDKLMTRMMTNRVLEKMEMKNTKNELFKLNQSLLKI